MLIVLFGLVGIDDNGCFLVSFIFSEGFYILVWKVVFIRDFVDFVFEFVMWVIWIFISVFIVLDLVCGYIEVFIWLLKIFVLNMNSLLGSILFWFFL